MPYNNYKAEIELEYARDRIDYNPNTGELIWKMRPECDFDSIRIAKSWNTKFAGKLAFNYIDKSKGKPSGLVGTFRSMRISAHVIAWFLHHGEWPRLLIDHINGNPLDNRIDNLREATFRENKINACRNGNNTSGVSGVSWHKGAQKWVAYISNYGKRINLGTFVFFEDAVKARKEAEKKYGYSKRHGEEALPTEALVAQVVLNRIEARQ